MTVRRAPADTIDRPAAEHNKLRIADAITRRATRDAVLEIFERDHAAAHNAFARAIVFAAPPPLAIVVALAVVVLAAALPLVGAWRIARIVAAARRGTAIMIAAFAM